LPAKIIHFIIPFTRDSICNKELQKDWKQHGEAGFMIEIIENLEYDKDGVRTDYSEDITLLQMIWEDKILQQGFELYKK
jgi:hypothetical protein